MFSTSSNNSVSEAVLDIKPHLFVVMGVSGCGKSTLAKALNASLDWPFQEGDALHPQKNIQKMSSGHPLTDQDRLPWLQKCHDWLLQCKEQQGGRGILTCSALKRNYRDLLRKDIDVPLYFLYLKVPLAVLTDRLAKRKGHFMPPALLQSQMDTLEPLQPDEPYLEIDMVHPIETVVQDTLRRLQEL